MCGIWLNIGSPHGAGPLDRLAHRGPDARGFQRLTVAGRQVELGHTRLSIIDLDPRANQPMSYGEELVLVYNGEVYNYVELRETLGRLGHVFRTRSDTEVLLAAYAAWGVDMLPRLRGMFAFALLDQRRRRLLLARDPFGIKPLFVCRTADGLAAASEIPPLLELPGVSRRSRPEVVLAFLDHGASDAGAATFLADVVSLEAAHYALIDLDRPTLDLEQCRYWKPVYDCSLADPVEAARLVRERFVDSVKVHLRADVPVGTMLSGGIDSSAVVAVERELLGATGEIHTFSFISPGDDIDESRYARLMAGHARTCSHEVHPDESRIPEEIERLVLVQGEPFRSTSMYAQYKVAEAAGAAGIKVLLDGQGSDELFGGYRFFVGARAAGLLAEGEPVKAARLLAKAVQAPGVKLPSMLYHTLASLDLPGARRLSAAAERRNGPIDLIDPRWRARAADAWSGRRLPRRLALIERLQSSLEHEVLPGLLRYEDRSTMAFSIEARVPFLDVPLAETACRLAPHLLVDDSGWTKSVLRAALRGLVPDAILDRRDKIGFATPEARWLRAAAPWTEAELVRATPDSVPFLQLEPTRAAIRGMLAGRRAWAPWAWRLMSVLLWTRLCAVEHPRV